MQSDSASGACHASGIFVFSLASSRQKPMLQIRAYTAKAYNRAKDREARQARKDRARYWTSKEAVIGYQQYLANTRLFQQRNVGANRLLVRDQDDARAILNTARVDHAQQKAPVINARPHHQELQHVHSVALQPDEHILPSTDTVDEPVVETTSLAVAVSGEVVLPASFPAVTADDTPTGECNKEQLSPQTQHGQMDNHEDRQTGQISALASSQSFTAIDTPIIARADSSSCGNVSIETDIRAIQAASIKRSSKRQNPPKLDARSAKSRSKASQSSKTQRSITSRGAGSAGRREICAAEETRADRALGKSRTGRERFRPRRSLVDGYT